MLIIILVEIDSVDTNDRGLYVGVFVGYGVVFLVPRICVGWVLGEDDFGELICEEFMLWI
jgi:hypothetical protein